MAKIDDDNETEMRGESSSTLPTLTVTDVAPRVERPARRITREYGDILTEGLSYACNIQPGKRFIQTKYMLQSMATFHSFMNTHIAEMEEADYVHFAKQLFIFSGKLQTLLSVLRQDRFHQQQHVISTESPELEDMSEPDWGLDVLFDELTRATPDRINVYMDCEHGWLYLGNDTIDHTPRRICDNPTATCFESAIITIMEVHDLSDHEHLRDPSQLRQEIVQRLPIHYLSLIHI